MASKESTITVDGYELDLKTWVSTTTYYFDLFFFCY